MQEFAWTEKDVPRKLQERASSLPQDSAERVCMDYEPMFCFEVGMVQAKSSWGRLCSVHFVVTPLAGIRLVYYTYGSLPERGTSVSLCRAVGVGAAW